MLEFIFPLFRPFPNINLRHGHRSFLICIFWLQYFQLDYGIAFKVRFFYGPFQSFYLMFSDYDDAKVFAIIYAVFSAYFAGVMVRLMLTLTPIVCMLSAVAFSETFNKYLLHEEEEEETTGQEM